VHQYYVTYRYFPLESRTTRAISLTIISVGYIIDVSHILTISSRVAKSSGTVDDCDSWDLHCLVLLHILLAISRGTLLIFGRTSALISIYTTSTARDDNSASLQFPWILIVMAHNSNIEVSLFGLFQNAWHNIVHVRMISFSGYLTCGLRKANLC